MKIAKLKIKNSSGFTLIEVSISVAVFALIAVGIVVLVSQILSQSNLQSGYLADSDQARRLGFKIMQELRNSVSSNTGAFALESAGPQEIIFYSNIDGGQDIERLRYFVDNGALKRGVVKPTGNPLTYNVATETVDTVQNSVANGANAVFYYYDGNYAGTTDTYLAQPVNVNQVSFVKMNLQIFHKGTSTGTAYYTITASSAIRNLKTNLGQ